MVGQAADGAQAVRVAAEVSPDVVVKDMMMPMKGGVEACRGGSWSPYGRPGPSS